MKIFFTYSLLFVIILSMAQTYNSPESVEFDAIHQRYIVANTTGSNLLAVIPGNPPTFFASTVPNPYGIAIVGDTVYVCCSSTHLRGYNLSNGTLAFDVNLGGTFLNGICSDFSGNIFVTDFTDKKIFRYNIASQQFNYFVGTAMANTPNGIVFDPFHHRLAIATWGINAPILGLNLSDSTITTLKATALTNIDGLTIDEDGNFYAADWGSDGIYFFDSGFINAPLKVVSGLSNPADISYNQLSDTLAVPNTSGNSVRFFAFQRPRPNNDVATVTVTTSQAICVLLNDVISGNIPLRLQSFTTPHLGTATTSGNCIVYTANSVGRDTIAYVVCSVDTPSFCRTGSLTLLNFNGSVNNAPIATEDTVRTIQPYGVTINVAENDFDVDSDTICITAINGSSFFTRDSANCTNIIFTPDSFFVGRDTCSYVICDNGFPMLCDTSMLIVICDPALLPVAGFNSWFTNWVGQFYNLSSNYQGNPVWTITNTSGCDDSTYIFTSDTIIFETWDKPCGIFYYASVCLTVSNPFGSSTHCDTLVIIGEGINEISLAGISIYPNPTNNLLAIDMQNNNEEITRNYSSIEILNVLGEKQKSVPKKGVSKVVTLDVIDLSNGIYLATIVSDKRERRMLGKFTISR